VIATLILQEMTARLGIIGQKGLGEALRQQFKNPFLKAMSIILVLSAILIGNAAYETGNILGASLGMIEISQISSITIGSFELQIFRALQNLTKLLL
jgi:Mn2+/Fe2+ NRAMP family transporter